MGQRDLGESRSAHCTGTAREAMRQATVMRSAAITIQQVPYQRNLPMRSEQFCAKGPHRVQAAIHERLIGWGAEVQSCRPECELLMHFKHHGTKCLRRATHAQRHAKPMRSKGRLFGPYSIQDHRLNGTSVAFSRVGLCLQSCRSKIMFTMRCTSLNLTTSRA
jgi:hypothetical protein